MPCLKRKEKTLSHVLEFNISDEILTERITGRRIHVPSGRSYHVKFNPPKVEGVDDITGEPLIHRSDDTVEALTKRLDSYHKQTSPILDYYRKKNVLKTFDASQKIDKVWGEIYTNST